MTLLPSDKSDHSEADFEHEHDNVSSEHMNLIAPLHTNMLQSPPDSECDL